MNKWSRRLVIAVHQTTRQPGERSAHLSPIDTIVAFTERAKEPRGKMIPLSICKFGSVGQKVFSSRDCFFDGSEFAKFEVIS